MAGDYASSHADELSGVIMFAAYSRKPLDDRLLLVRVYGSEDGVLSMGKVTENSKNYPSRYIGHLIEGGNHAQFGCYGPQRGDGAATITAEEQQAEAVDAVIPACDQHAAHTLLRPLPVAAQQEGLHRCPAAFPTSRGAAEDH